MAAKNAPHPDSTMHEKPQTNDEHYEARPSAENDDAKHDLEKSSLSQVATEDQEYFVTVKTWIVVWAMSLSYAASFWPVPFFSQIQSQIAVDVGASAGEGAWITSVFITAVTIAFMICGANSDLFGRRYFILPGHVFVFVGAIVGGTSHSMAQTIVAHVLLGFGSGNCQLSAFAIPELLPNRWRHIGVVIADGVAFFAVIAGPVTARVSIAHGSAWRWGYWSVAITILLSGGILFMYYYPPKRAYIGGQESPSKDVELSTLTGTCSLIFVTYADSVSDPRGIPWDQALKHLDWVGIVTFTLSAAMILSGIVYVQLLPSNSPTVIGLLVAGFGTLVFFSLWETFAPLQQPLTPTRLFTKNKGRTLTAPFIVGSVVTMFYYGCNIIWGTMVSVFFSTGHIYWLATVQGFGILTGGVLLWTCGNALQHWRWQMGLSVAWMTLFGGLLAYITPERQGCGVAFAFLSAVGFGYSQYLSITYIQFGASQVELGISGGLAGVARTAGGAIATTVFLTILVSVQSSYALNHVVPAAEAAGASPKVSEAVAAALPLGTAALDQVHGLTTAIANAAGAAFVESYVHGLRTVSLTLMGFGGVGIIACFFIEDIGPKMNRKIEVFLENDVEAHMNRYH